MIQEEIILKYLNNQASSDESRLVKEWAAKNPLDFKLTEDIFVESSHAKDITLFDLDAEWDSFMDAVEAQETVQESIEQQEAKLIDIQEKSSAKTYSIWRELRPALLTASMLLVAIVAYFLYPRNEVVHLADANGKELTLPDNTTVTLEEHATVTYPRSFKNKDKRIVKLDGIAVFDITPDPDKPFIVETNLAGVKALGTVFEVDATDVSKTGVKNLEGLINFFDVVDTSKSVNVKEGESFVYDGSDFQETTPLPDPTFRTFELPKPPAKTYTVREIVNYMYRISNGHAVPKGNDFDWNKRIEIDLNTYNFDRFVRKLRTKARVQLVKKGCSDCYEIKSVRVK